MKTQLGRLTWKQILGLSAPALMYAGFEIPVRVFMPIFLAEHVGLTLGVIGTIFLLARVWDMVSDPLIGILTDATRSRFGRRRPWIVAGIPLALLGTWHLYFAQAGTGPVEIALWFIVVYTGWTMIIVPHGAWGVEISNDRHERSRIFGFKMLAVAAALPLFAIGPAILERTTGAAIDEQIALIGLLIICGLPLAIGILLAVVPEPDNPSTRLTWAAIADSFFVVFRHAPFARISGIYFLVGAADAITAGIFIFLVRDALGLPNWAATFLVVQALLGFVGIPIWLAISKRCSKEFSLGLIFVVQLVLAPIPLILPHGSVAAFFAYVLMKGLIWGADYMLLRSIVADLVEADATGSQSRRAGVFYASFNLTLKLAAALGGAGVFWLLSVYGFDPGAVAAERAAFSDLLRGVMAVVPVVAASAAYLLLLGFKSKQVDAQCAQPSE